MPELPEVETVARGLRPILQGHRLDRVITRRPDLRFPLPDGFAQVLTGATIKVLGRRAKYLIAETDRDVTLIMHLGMSGRFVMDDTAGTHKHDHVIFETAGSTVAYRDPRRFGFMDLTADPDHHPMLSILGPEPLDDAFDAKVLLAGFKGRRTPLKAALLDQKIVCGLGNIYVCEALFRAGLSPERQAATLGPKRAERLVGAIKSVLTEAIEKGGSTLRDYAQADGTLGYFQHSFSVYGREGEACPGCDCDPARTGGIRRIVQSNRSTFYCPRRQK
ncbi:MAG: bifunctional DNA-formamidopyrimidine glycosylase/DNA-(apurinic or apyrimidinic site) lyase [Magnetovibrionaceae bacterium]